MNSYARFAIAAWLLSFASLHTPVFAQAPSLLWTNSGGRVFAVDGQTNVYAHVNGTITKLSPDGLLLETNVLSSLPGVPQRDSTGAYYFVGALPGTGTNGQQYPNGAFFLAKYTSAGSMIWSNNFGPTGSLSSHIVSDLQLDSQGNAYAAYTVHDLVILAHGAGASKFDATGSNVWSSGLPTFYGGSKPVATIRFGVISPTNGSIVNFQQPSLGSPVATLSQFNSNGTMSVVTTWLYQSGPILPLVMNPGGDFYTVENVSGLNHRSATGSVLSHVPFAGTTVGRDEYSGVHVATSFPNNLSRYDSVLNLIWTITLPLPCTELYLDSSNNRFLSLAGETVGRLTREILLAPGITNAPYDTTVLLGSNAVFSVGTTGTPPFAYFWVFNGATVGTNATLNLNNVSTNQTGSYFVIVSNLVGSVTSAPAMLRVKRVAIYAGNQLLTNGTYYLTTSQTLNIRSTFAGGSLFYTVNGSPPSFASTFYSGPFPVSQSATVRAIGYSSDFLQSEEADAVNVVVLHQHTLTASSPGGGSVSLSPPGGTYVETNVVTATAVPLPGWTFLYWQGYASGTDPVVTVSMERNKTIQAIFGTSLSTTVMGNGQIVVDPLRALYPYGEIVRLTGVPQPGNYFGAWGNALTGNTNPSKYTITVTNPTVLGVFAPVPAGQAALTILITGHGNVGVSPRANVYSSGQPVVLTAQPDPGSSFTNWTGDASGTQNPLTVFMDQNRLVNANFRAALKLSVNRAGLEGMFPPIGFRLSVIGDYPRAYQIFGSSNLLTWEGLGVVTNDSGEVQFLDAAVTNVPLRFYRAAPVP